MIVIKYLYFLSILFFCSGSIAQHRLDVTIKIPSIADSSRFRVHVFDLGNIFYIDEVVSEQGLIINRAVKGNSPRINIEDTKTDSMYVVLLDRHKGDIVFKKDPNSEKMNIDVSEGLIVLGDNSIFKEFFRNRRNNPDLAEISKIFQLNFKKSDSLQNRLSTLLKQVYEDESSFLKKFGDDYIAFDIFKDQVLVFKSFLESDSAFIERYKEDMLSIFSSKIKDTPEFKSAFENITPNSQPKILEKVDMSTTFTDIYSKPIILSDIKSKYILIDFWATWCPPCLKTIPEIKGIREDFSSSDLEIIGVSADHSIKNLKKGISDHKMEWIHIYDEMRDIQKYFRVTSLPTLILIDNKGEIHWRSSGFSENKLKEIRAILEN